MLKKLLTKAVQGLLGSFLLFNQGYAADYCNYDNNCCSSDGFWLDAEYLYWKVQNGPKEVPFVIEGPFDVLDPVLTLDSPGSSSVLGGKSEKTDWRSGGKITAGYWFDDSRCFGAEISYFCLPNKSHSRTVFSDGTDGSTFLAIPFFDLASGTESSTFLSFPGQYSGFARLKTWDRMQGVELNALASSSYDCNTNYGFLGGFRYWNYEDSLTFETSSPNVVVPPAIPDVYNTQDKFRTKNNFYGFQLGAYIDYSCNSFFFDAKVKVALGGICQKLNINGFLETNDFDVNGIVNTYQGGYFTFPSNIGSHKKTKFSWIPEVNLNIGYKFSDCLKLKIGYTFLYVSNVLRAANQVNRNINPTQSVAIEFDPETVLVGTDLPRANLKSKSLWAQGLNVGLEFSF